MSKANKILARLRRRAFVLRAHKESDELHIFDGWVDRFENFEPEDKSCCPVVLEDTDQTAHDVMESEDQFRIYCAEIGRSVCGRCVSTLYGTGKEHEARA